MTPNPALMKSVEQLGHRVTVGDVATQAGLELNQAEQGLLALAADAGGQLQVADTGDIVYEFPNNFRGILRSKYRRLQWQAWWEKVWRVLFYLIRISFGIILVLSIVLMIVAIAVIVIAMASANKDNNRSSSNRSYRSGGGGGLFFFPRFWFYWGPDPFWMFRPNYGHRAQQRQRTFSSSSREQSQLNFLEAIYSFLFGDGNPNENLEERRWQSIGNVIRGNGGAVAAEQLAPYCDEISAGAWESEEYVLPTLTKFNGQPKVSDQGDIVYYFPELQVSAKERGRFSVQAYLKEIPWQFTQASSTQKLFAIGLGALNIVLALVLGSLLQDDIVTQLGGFIAFIDGIYGLLLAYGIAFLGIPLIRNFWLQRRNAKIAARNHLRQERAITLNQDETLQQKMTFAQQFAGQKVIGDHDITYSTDKDLLDQEIERSDKIDEEWRRRLESN